MPILKRELELFPQGIFALSEADFPWSVAYTRSRQDKALARSLHTLAVPFYLPCREKRIRRAGRTFVSHVPLFSGYVFFRGSPAVRQAAIRSNLIVQILHVIDQDLLTSELLQIRQLREAGAELTPYFDFVPGDSVRITEGPFAGYTGVLVRAHGRLRLLVSISMLRQTIAVEFERNVVAPLHLDSSARQKDYSAAAS